MTLDWFSLVLIYIASNAVSKILQKIALRGEEVDPTAFSAFFLFTVGILTTPFLLLENRVISLDLRVWGVVLLSGIFYTVCMGLYYYALKHTEVSQVETISTTRAVWIMALGVLFFREALTVSKAAGVLCIFLGLAVIYWQGGSFSGFKKPHLFTLLYAMIISGAYALDKYCLASFSVAFYQTVIYILPAILTVIFLPGTLSKIRPLVRPRKSNGILFLACLFQMVSTLALYRAYQVGGELSVVGPLAQTSTVLTIFLGILFLRERWNLRRKVAGALLTISGIILIKVLNF